MNLFIYLKAKALVYWAKHLNGGEYEYHITPINILTVWEWAETHKMVDIQAGISILVAEELIDRFRGENLPEWRKKFLFLANKAKSENRPGDYAGFIEALIRISLDSKQRKIWGQELYDIYLKLGEWKKMISCASFLIDSNKIKESGNRLLHAYEVSTSRNYKKGILLTLIGFGSLLKDKNPIMASQFYHKAKLIGKEIGSIYSITARDMLTNLNIPESRYISNLTIDDLILEFKRTYN